MPLPRHRRHRGAPVIQDGPSLVVVLAMTLVAVHIMRLAFAGPGQAMDDPATPGVISVAALRRGEWWTVLTHLFIHGSWEHLAGNVVLLWLAGRGVLATIGSRHFAAVYFLSGIAGAACALAVHPKYPVAGASGAIFGLLGAFAALHPERSVTERIHRIVPWRLRAKFLFWGFLGSSVFLEVLSALTADGPHVPLIHGVAHLAHVGGLVAGWVYGGRLAPSAAPVWMRDDFFPQALGRRRREGPVATMLRAGPPMPGGPAPSPSAPERVEPPELPGDEEFLRDTVDPILDKLYEGGMGSLTDEERAILDEAASRFSRRPQ